MTNTSKIKVHHMRTLKRTMLLGAGTLLFASAPTLAQDFTGESLRTTSNDKTLMYGALSSVISSSLLSEDPAFLSALSSPNADTPEQTDKLKTTLDTIRHRYHALSESDANTIIKSALSANDDALYSKRRSVIYTPEQNLIYNQNLKDRSDLREVSNILDDDGFKTTDVIQFNVHRGLYNSGYLIPQNSLAGAVNAYVAGLRSVEFDVLESKDNVNIVLHDLNTKRIIGNYFTGESADKATTAEFLRHGEKILNPFAAQPTAITTPVDNLMTTEMYLQRGIALMPEVTFYADARNYSPVSLFKLLTLHPDWRKHVVTKIYPFNLKTGGADLLKNYVNRYLAGKTAHEAEAEIAKEKPFVLLAIGTVDTSETPQELRTATSFSPEKFSYIKANVIPFTHGGNTDYNNIVGVKFTDEEYKKIDDATYSMFQWAMSFSCFTKPVIIQETSLPSLRAMIDKNVSTDSLSGDERITSAVHDNLAALFKELRAGKLGEVTSKCANGATIHQEDVFKNVALGISDRYPDFTLAVRNDVLGSDGSYKVSVADQGIKRDYYYDMFGKVYESNLLGNTSTRSVRSMMDRAKEAATYYGMKFVYFTTDLPEDLRAGLMGMLGKSGLPEDITIREGALVNPKMIDQSTPDSLKGDKIPAWLKK